MPRLRSWSLLSCVIAAAACSAKHRLSDHCDGHRFYNQDRSVDAGKSFADVIRWRFSGEQLLWPDHVDDQMTPDLSRPLSVGQGAVTLINHATELVQFQNFNVLTDPVFSKRVSPVSWAGPERHRPPAVPWPSVPKIDLVVISHNHYDHMNLESLAAIHARDKPVFVVPLGNGRLLAGEGIDRIVELDWWESHRLASGAVVTLVPMQHWSARGLFDRSEALWGGFVIQASGLAVLFAGDTGYNRQFKDILARFGPMDLSLLPIGAYAPRWFMNDHHMDPAQAVQAHDDLASKLSLGMHFGTFQLTDEGIDDPVHELTQVLAKAGPGASKFYAPKHGQTIFFSKSLSEK